MKIFILSLIPILLFGQKLKKPQLLQNVHQYIVREAYELLKYEKPAIETTEMNSHIGTYKANGPWSTQKIVAGAYREDEEDVVYGYGGLFNGWDPSSTHFWDVDGGDGSKITIFPNDIENAYQKARVFIYGSDIWGNNKIFLYQGGDWPQFGIYNTLGWYMSYDNLFDLYTTGKYYWEGYVDIAATTHYIHYGPFYMTPDSRNYYVWEILGRVAHLLGDMGVPAHVHNDIHPNGDTYENTMSIAYASQWNHSDAYNNGGIINVTNKYDPLRYLFYTSSQISDHFPSDDYPGSNDYILNYGNDQYVELQNILLSLGTPPSSVNVYNTANTSFITSIRAVAGLLYWFAIETRMLQVPCTINIINTFEFDTQETANPQNGFLDVPTEITALSPIYKNGRTYSFSNWSDGVTSNPRTIIPELGSTYTAIYKAHLQSSIFSSTSIGNQRKIARDGYSGNLYMVYPSSNKIWYTYSTDQGSTWSDEQCVSGSGDAYNPSIASSGLSWEEDEVYFVWQELSGGTRNLYIRSHYNITSPSLLDSDPAGSDMQPSVAVSSDESKVLVIYKKMYSGRYQVHYKYSSDGGNNFYIGGPLSIGTPIIWNLPSVVWNPQSSKFIVSTISSSSSLSVDLLGFDGTTWTSEGNVYYSNQVPNAAPYSQVAVDGTGRTHVTWIAYDNYYGENSAAMERSMLNGNWSAVTMFRDEIIYDPSIVYTSVCGHNDADGGASIFYTSGSNQTLFDIYSTDNSSWNGTIYISPSAPISYPVALEKAVPQSVSYITVKGSSSPYNIISQTKNNSQPGTYSGTLKAVANNETEGAALGNVKQYRRIELIDTTGNSTAGNDGRMLIVQFGNISGKRINFSNTDSVVSQKPGSSFMSTLPFSLMNGDSLSVDLGIKGKNWKGNSKIKFELLDAVSGETISNIDEHYLSQSDTGSYCNEKANKIVNKRQNINAVLRVKLDGIDYKDLVVNNINVMMLGSNNNTSKAAAYNEKRINLMPMEINLCQNYPNPFNPSTTITYSLKEKDHVTLIVFDILGKEVTRLVDGIQTEGEHSINFDGSDLPSGMYIYRLKGSNFNISKKMLMIK